MAPALHTVDLLQRVMREHGYANAQEMSEASGVPYNTVYRWVTGASTPHRRNLAAFLQALGLDPAIYGVRGPAASAGATGEVPEWATALDAKLDRILNILESRP